MSNTQSGCGGVHPATRIFLWLCLLVLLPALPPLILAALAVCCCLLLPFHALARRYLWRTRMLLLVLLVVLPWTTPGVFVWPDLASLSPTREGVAAAARHSGHAAVALVGLALALGGLDLQGRLTAFVSFLLPLHHAGLPVERLAVRLVLTLQQLEVAPARRGWHQWSAAWQSALQTDVEPHWVELDVRPWRVIDYVLAGVASAGVLLCVGR